MALSSAMPARGLHATCLVVMVLSGVHLAVTLLYYLDMHVYSGRMVRRFGSFLVEDGAGTAEGPLANSTNSSYSVEYHTPRSPPPSPLQPCPDTPPHLVGPLSIEFSQTVDLEDVKNTNSLLREGGRFTPVECTALQKVAIIIPFRNRFEHLKYWLYFLHPILQRQQLDYGVYVINQICACFFYLLQNIEIVKVAVESDCNSPSLH